MPDDKVLSLFLSLPTGKEAAKTKPAEAVASDEMLNVKTLNVKLDLTTVVASCVKTINQY